jgi:hypothetical protein
MKLQLDRVKSLNAPKLKLPLGKTEDQSTTLLQRLQDLSMSLLPVSTEFVLVQGEIFSNYEINLLDHVPSTIKESFNRAGIIFNVTQSASVGRIRR